MLNGGNRGSVNSAPLQLSNATECTRLEVLNISNKNARGEVVLNDEFLLQLMQRYPFLYNVTIQPNQDPCYDTWAWENIATVFNSSYAEMTPSTARRHFTVSELQQRWRVLTPIIKSLSKAYDLNSIPESLRQNVISIATALDNHALTPPQITAAQSIVLENIPWVKNLPLEERRRLEAEFMELLLATELSSRCTVYHNHDIEQRVDQEYEDFLKAIRLKELFVLSNNEPVTANEVEHLDESSIESPDVFVMDAATDTNSQSTSPENSNDMFKPPPCIVSEEQLLKPMPEPMPMPRLHYHQVRPCVVRLKRLNLEEYLPLAQIARIKRERDSL